MMPHCRFAFAIVPACCVLFCGQFVGCGRDTEDGLIKTWRSRQAEQNASVLLEEHGWELTQTGAMWTATFRGEKLTPDMMQRLSEFRMLTELHLSDQVLDNDIIECISRLDSLQTLSVAGTTFDDKDLQTLSACPMLTMIDALGTQVTTGHAEAWIADRKTDASVVVFCRDAIVQTGARE